ncbi:transporter substrate-binding domain-containing protein [bacterium]|nr:transporter substrate-binding domain-containing protein [bacterium]
MKSPFAILVGALLLVSLALSGCAPATTPEKLVLVVGVDPQHPYLRKHISFLREVLASIDLELEVQRHQSARCFELSNSGQVDGELWRIHGIEAEYTNLVRVPVALWSHPELAFVQNDLELDGWASLAPYRVAYRVGTKIVENNIEGIVTKKVPLQTIAEGFDLLAKGEVDVVISDNIVGSLLLEDEKYGTSGIKQVERPLDSALLYTYLHRKHADRISDLAEAIKRAKRDGTYDRLIGESPVDD